MCNRFSLVYYIPVNCSSLASHPVFATTINHTVVGDNCRLLHIQETDTPRFFATLGAVATILLFYSLMLRTHGGKTHRL